MDKDKKYYYIEVLAVFLVLHGKTMTMKDLASHLTHNGFKTSYDTEYKGARGTFTLIKTVYDWANIKGLNKNAVAIAFTDDDGNYAYNK